MQDQAGCIDAMRPAAATLEQARSLAQRAGGPKMGKKGRKGADDWEKDFELDDEGNLAALKQDEPAEAAAPAGKQAVLPVPCSPGRPSAAELLGYHPKPKSGAASPPRRPQPPLGVMLAPAGPQPAPAYAAVLDR